MNSIAFDSKVGPLVIKEEDSHITAVLLSPTTEELDEAKASPSSSLLFETKTQILEYLDGTRRSFSLPLAFKGGTIFQRRVWSAIAQIPYGETRSYGELSGSLGTKGFQAVGSACGKNPLPLIIPCHRVIAGNGTLGGFSGPMETKRHLLRMEGAVVKGL